jgi:hypothetical protein
MEEEMTLPMDEQVEETTIQVLILTNQLVLVSEVREVLADIGQPDCLLIKPFQIKKGISENNYLVPWLFGDYTNEKEIAISSDKILALVDPKKDLLEEYLKLSK